MPHGRSPPSPRTALRARPNQAIRVPHRSDFCVDTYTVDSLATTELLTNFWFYSAVAFSIIAIYMANTYFRVKAGTRKPRKSYLQYMTTKRYREIWMRQKAKPSYYATRFWIAATWVAVSAVRIFHP